MNPFSRVLSGYQSIPSEPAQMLLYSMMGVLESYWAEDNSIVTPSPNAHRDVVSYLTARFGKDAPVTAFARTLWAGRLTR
jgi:hypothetical protein